MSSADPEHREEEEAPTAGEDEDTGAQVAPIVKLEEVAVTTGEEDEDPILDLYALISSFFFTFRFYGFATDRRGWYWILADRRKSKLYRFDKDGNQWKERGAGTVKFLKHKVSGKVRLLMRQSKTLKICANHLILSTMTVQEHAGNEKSCVWHARDFADGELKDELFCIRFPSIENCKSFMETFQEVAESQKTEDDKESSAAAGLIEKLSVEEKADAEKKDEQKSEDKAGEQESTSGKESKADKDKKAEEPASSA
ncbi:Ran-binding protein 1-like b [Spatholobus suberectus]|nr:Ran-binding protein 1-like b [Spatholobus suberectus]